MMVNHLTTFGWEYWSGRLNNVFFILLTCIVNDIAVAQNSLIFVDYPNQDIGTIEDVNSIQTEFIIKNTGSKNLYVLRADTKQNIKVRINRKMISAGDTSMLFANIELRETGRLDEEIKIVTSADALPLVLTIKGNIKSIKTDDKTACFYFNKVKRKNVSETVIIPMPSFKLDTLRPTKKALPPQSVEVLDRSIYKSSNITFLIDVSYSMHDSLKLPVMKEAMFALIKNLRDIDNVNIITYSKEPLIVREGVRGDKKETLNSAVNSLIAEGPTMGAQAILFSLDVVLNHFKAEGNNQLFLVTDGKFKYSDKLYEQWKQKIKGKNISFTVIALGDDVKAIQQLQEMTILREGTFIQLQNKEQVQAVLLEDIKAKSKR
jgi:Mg-chelatase subunit ChlD